jgi:hypothetical protein
MMSIFFVAGRSRKVTASSNASGEGMLLSSLAVSRVHERRCSTVSVPFIAICT